MSFPPFSRLLGALGVAAASALVPAALDAQTLRLNALPSNAPTIGVVTQTTTYGPAATWKYAAARPSVRSSPYLATFTPVGGAATAIQLICADILSTAKFRETYAVNVTSLAGAPTLVDTRWVAGMQVSDNKGVLRETLANDTALVRYRKASYLGAFMTEANKAQWDDIQLAIWEVMTPYTIRNLVPEWTGRTSQAWLEQAEAAAAGGFAGYSFRDAVVLTDADVDDVGLQGSRAHVGRQEFVTAAQVVPEPSTYVLLGTGLAAVAGVARRRRRA